MRGVRRRARRQPRDHDRPDGQPAQRRRGRADVQAARQHRHAPRPGRGDRRRRRPLRAGPLLRSRPTSTSTSTSGPRPPATTRSSTCSTPTPGSPRSCATPPTSASRPSSHPDLLTHEKEGELLRALAEFPRVVARRDHAARAAPGGALPRGHRRVVPPVLRQLPGAADGRRGARPTCTGPGCCWSRPPGSSSPTGSACSGSPPPSGCEGAAMPTHEAGWAHADGALRGPSWLREPARPQRPGRRALVDHHATRSTASSSSAGSRCPTWSPTSTRRRTSSTRPTSGPAPARSARRSRRTTSTTPARRSSARRSRAGSPRRGSASTSAPTVS